jgi:aspartokinase/homoserine dehydrogenase 1
MKRIVVKFGGSNLKSRTDINRLLKVIKSYNVPIVIVISALYGVTDLLSKSFEKIKKDEKAIDALIKTLLDKHRKIVIFAIDDKKVQDRVIEGISERLNVLSKYLLGTHYLGDVPDFVSDLVLSYGERISSYLLNVILQSNGFDSEELLPEDIGLFTDGVFRNATVDFDRSSAGIKSAIRGSKIYVIPGFYGISKESKVTLLGRGGSDYSAAAIARCIGAVSVDLWKDVPGFMSADPKIITDPVQLKNLTYKEAAELSYFGARILHPRTFEPLMDKNIPIRIYDINNIPENLEPLTLIQKKRHIKEGIVKSVTHSEDVGIIKLRGPGVGIKPGIIAEAASALNNAGINIKSIITSQTTINLIFSLEDLEKSYDILIKKKISFVDNTAVYKGIALIAVVGEGMLEMPGIAAKVFKAVSDCNINIQIISAGASSVATYFIIEKKSCMKAIRAIHKEFFSEDNQRNQ